MVGKPEWLQQLLERRQQEGKHGVQEYKSLCTPVKKCSVPSCGKLVTELAPGHSWCKDCAASFDRIFESK